MVASYTDEILDELGLRGRTAPELFHSIIDVSATPINGYTHTLRRAWKSFDNLVAVFSVRGRPTVYLQQTSKQAPLSVKEQQRFWSHGLAPILARITPTEVRIYSSLRTPALPGENVDDNGRLLEVFNRAAQSLELRQFMRSVEAETVYGRYAKHFDPSQAVDRRLVHNLQTTRDLMSSGNKAPSLAVIHRLLGRVLFTCYLEARGALLRRDFGRLGAGASASFRNILNLSTIAESRTALTRFFRRLARYFRGSLFMEDPVADLKELRDNDLVTLRELLNGTDLFSGQYALPFDTYDFSVIPIETVSAVYEDFVRAEGEDEQKKKGAFYTPPKLVDFTMDLATENQPDLTDKKVLDPGCGSGVFLVSAFNRKAETWVRRHNGVGNSKRARALAKILREEICGVDLNPIACQATCFSLYLAMLDFLEPPEIRRLGRERLPSLFLDGQEKRRVNGPQTVIRGNFLTPLPALEGMKFDFVVGNPPWVARGNVEERAFNEWQARHPSDRFPMPAKQLACAFMWNIPELLTPDGHACLLLPAKILLGDQTDAFQQQWFSRHRVDKVAQLSDLRFILFPTASHPTVAVRFRASPPASTHRIDFVSPKASHSSLFGNFITVEPEDRRQLGLTELLKSAAKNEAAVFWMSHNWTTPRDREFLTRLRSLRPLSELVGEPSEGKRWNKGQGIQPFGEDEGSTTPFWGPEHLFLDAKRNFELLLSPSDVTPIGSRFPSPHRTRDRRVFVAPLVVFNQGFSKIAFSSFDVLFRDALQSVSGPAHDADLLKFLTATLLSPLSEYFLFHLSSKYVYRYAFLSEVLRMPFPLPDEAPGKNGGALVTEVAKVFSGIHKDPRFDGLGHAELVRETKRTVTELVYAYYDINDDEAVLIEDTIKTLAKSAMPRQGSHVPLLRTPNKGDREAYAEEVIKSLDRWTRRSTIKLSASGVVSESAGVAVLTIASSGSNEPYRETTATTELDAVLLRLRELAPDRYGSLVYLRNLAVMERDRIHIVKPLTRRFWLRSTAMNDADAAAAHLLHGRSRRAL